MQYSRFKKVYPSLQIVRITRQRSGQRSPLSKFVNFITDHTSISTLSHFSKVRNAIFQVQKGISEPTNCPNNKTAVWTAVSFVQVC